MMTHLGKDGLAPLLAASLLVWVGCRPDVKESNARVPPPEPLGESALPVAAHADSPSEGKPPMTFSIESPAFTDGQLVPVRFTADGADLSPALRWSAPPKETAELALIMDDPDAPTPQPWVHWVIYKIPATVAALPEGVPTTPTLAEPNGASQGKNSFGKIGYGGPAPPKGRGIHRYHFKLYALDHALAATANLTKDALLTAMEGHVLASAELVGTYER